MNSELLSNNLPPNWTYAPPNPEYVSLNILSINVTLPSFSFSPVISAKTAPPLFVEVVFVNSQFSIYNSPPFLRPIAPAVKLAFRLINLEFLIVADLILLKYNAVA